MLQHSFKKPSTEQFSVVFFFEAMLGQFGVYVGPLLVNLGGSNPSGNLPVLSGKIL